MKLKVKVGPKGQIVIPKAIREKMGINPGDLVLLDIEGERAIVEATHYNPLEKLSEISRKAGAKSSELVWGDKLYQELLRGV
ncbi:MAG: AbrB/MazE/SpoVT family DNA-binding domain-containing protein [Methanocellales archaeon]